MIDDIRKQAAWLAEIYQGVADGRELQFWNGGSWVETGIGPHLAESRHDFWRLKPEPRECVSHVRGSSGEYKVVLVPTDWPNWIKVRVTEILEDEE